MYILPNLLCEYEMAGRLGDLPAAARAVETRWSHALRLVPGFEDAEILERASVVDDAARPHMLAWCDLRDLRGNVREIVVRANDQRTSHEIERELGVAPEGATIIASVQDLDAACARVSGRWVVKHPFGVAGRERVLGSGSADERARKWCTRQFEHGWTLVFEPWLENGAEFSTHWDVDDEITFLGSCELLTHGEGTFRGIEPSVEAPGAIVDQGRKAAEKLAQMGYRGPLGVDAIVGELGGRRVERGVMELNARWTFGRLGLHVARRAGRAVRWRHDSAEGELGAWGEWETGAVRLPEWADPGGRSGSWVEVADE